LEPEQRLNRRQKTTIRRYLHAKRAITASDPGPAAVSSANGR